MKQNLKSMKSKIFFLIYIFFLDENERMIEKKIFSQYTFTKKKQFR